MHGNIPFPSSLESLISDLQKVFEGFRAFSCGPLGLGIGIEQFFLGVGFVLCSTLELL